MSKIACVITDLFEDSEYTEPRQALEDAGHQVVTIGLEQGVEVTGKSKNTKVKIEFAAQNANPQDFDALFIPGGYSPDKLRGNENILDFVRPFAMYQKPIFSICHAPQLLVNAGVLNGKNLTAVKQVGQDVINAGGNYFDAEVVIDPSGLISSRTPDDLPAFKQAIVQALDK